MPRQPDASHRSSAHRYRTETKAAGPLLHPTGATCAASNRVDPVRATPRSSAALLRNSVRQPQDFRNWQDGTPQARRHLYPPPNSRQDQLVFRGPNARVIISTDLSVQVD